jgi:hypothetical protein
MKILQYLEKAWIGAIIVSLIVALYNLITVQKFNHLVYFPIISAAFCALVWFNIRGQRRFRERIIERTDENNLLNRK